MFLLGIVCVTAISKNRRKELKKLFLLNNRIDLLFSD
jgi:hypothetical protein